MFFSLPPSLFLSFFHYIISLTQIVSIFLPYCSKHHPIKCYHPFTKTTQHKTTTTKTPCQNKNQKTEHDFNLEKQTLVHEAKLSIQEEFAKKEKDREIQERIARSAEIGECRVKKMKVRDELLQTLLAESGSKCAVVARGNNYPQLLQKLIVQGLIKIEENEVTVFCRGADVATVTKVLPEAVKEYVDIIKREAGVTLHPVVSVNTDRSQDLPDSTHGGVLLTALNGKIKCDNTMASRLNLVYEELLPSIRAILFPQAQ